MNQVNNEFLERYQKLWDADQTSKVFAPLAEAYRKNGNLHQALQICRQGLNQHPNFAGGWLQLAKIYKDREEFSKAIGSLKKAVALAPENIQAHTLLGDLLLTQKQPKEALKAFKMVLLLSPENSRARKIIERLESLTADEYDDETFQIDSAAYLINPPPPPRLKVIGGQTVESLNDASEDEESSSSDSNFAAESLKKKQDKEKNRALTQTLTLVDALLVRNEFLKAKSIVSKALRKWGKTQELEDLLNIIEQQQEKSYEDHSPEIIQPLPPRAERIRQLKLQKLESLLTKLKKTPLPNRL